MDNSNDQALVSELKQIYGLLGEALAELDSEPNRSREKFEGIRAALNEMSMRMAGTQS